MSDSSFSECVVHRLFFVLFLWTCRITMTTATIMVQWKDTQNGQPLWLPAMDFSKDQGGREGVYGGTWREELSVSATPNIY